MEKSKNENTSSDNTEILLTEVLQQLQAQGKTISDVVASLNTLTGKVQQIEATLLSRKEVQQTVDINPVKEVVRKEIAGVKLFLSGVEKPVIKKFQILLFPEQDAKLFYKIVFGRWFLMIVIALFLKIVYNVFSKQQEINRQIKLEAQKNDPVIKAWNYLYQQKNRRLHELMDSALAETPRFLRPDIP